MPHSPPGSGAPYGRSAPESPLSVLLIADNPDDARLFEECLEESPVEATLHREESLQADPPILGEAQPDVLVVDLGLSNGEGPETVEAAAAAAPTVPIVVLTGPDTPKATLQTREAGATEFLRKAELTPVLTGRTLRWAAQRHRMQQKLRQQDAWIQSITEEISAGVFRVGPTGRIEYANKALAEILGSEQVETLIGRDLTTFYADPADQGRILTEEGADDVEIELKTADGSAVVGLLSAKAAYDASGDVLHYDGVLVDITERKETEEPLREREAQLRGIANSIPGVVFRFYARPNGERGLHFAGEHA